MLLKDDHEKRDHHRSCSVLFGMGIACTWPVAAAESHCSAPPAARLVTRHQYIIRNESDVDVPVEQPLQVNATQVQEKDATVLVANSNRRRRRSLLQKPETQYGTCSSTREAGTRRGRTGTAHVIVNPCKSQCDYNTTPAQGDSIHQEKQPTKPARKGEAIEKERERETTDQARPQHINGHHYISSVTATPPICSFF